MTYLNGSIARRWAETAWGRGGTNSSRTNRTGVYYYSCSGHGGYILDTSVLSSDEYDALKDKLPTYEVLVVLDEKGKLSFIQNPFTFQTQRYKFCGDYTRTTMEVMIAEEDSDWAYLEAYTDIRCHDSKHAKADAVEVVRQREQRETEEKKAKEYYKNSMVVISALRQDTGMIMCHAVPGGNREYIRTPHEKKFLVPDDEYDMWETPIGFIIKDHHQMVV